MTPPDAFPPSEHPPSTPGNAAQTPALHLQRSFKWQALLRLAIVLACITDLAVFPPSEQLPLSIALAAAYTLWTLATLWAAYTSRPPLPSWIYPLTDLTLLTTLMAVSGNFSDPNWSSPLSADIFLFIPVLASFQMRPVLTAVSGILAAACYALGTGLGHLEHPYWHYTAVHTLFILVVCAGCVLLSDVQQHRVQSIRELAEHRLWLLDRIMATEETEQRKIAETLHDGALQNILAARHFIDEAVTTPRPTDALQRADEALTQASRQLRTSVRTLHPEVLTTGGLVPALQHLTEQASERGKFHAEIHTSITTAGTADRPLFWLAREILENVVKHAHAKNVTVSLQPHDHNPENIQLTITDDGIGIPQNALTRSLASGHIGLASHRARIEGIGGTFTIRNNTTGGTTVEAVVPQT
ncbi:ATP-binding protein [Streptomyces sp. Caat 7-52]|uniref:sensor histidine kinase n=1 Tax=Streptomyces sp. Caat 7-52 TaxID=2949637 RepID=UPI002034B300|nr:ATP-binding protein [Streptomyces sp. Caat 7-52]